MNAVFFSREHIEANRGAASALVAEQAVHSLELVSRLDEAGLEFRFKGGNSLLLLLPEPKRFSIDVDIATAQPRERIEECLDAAVRASGGFTRWARRAHKTKPWLPLASFEVYFESAFGAENSFIFLDAQLKEAAYPGRRVLVKCGTLYESGRTCEIATSGGILGDKLLTLGPATLGIPVGKGKEAQRLKHVFDVACLAATSPDVAQIRESVASCMKSENALQQRSLSWDEVLADTLALCTSALPYERPPAGSGLSPVLSEIVRGLAPFASHLFEPGYGWIRLQQDLGAVALCLAAVDCERFTSSDLSAALAGGASPPFGHAVIDDLWEWNPVAAARFAAAMPLLRGCGWTTNAQDVVFP